MEGLTWAEWLFIDKLYQTKFYKHFAMEIMRLIEKRYSEPIVTFIT